MKKIFLMLAVAASALSCMKESATPTVEDGGQTVFTGEFLSSKITLGNPQNGQYPALWEADDAVAVYNASDNTLIGKATIDPAYDNGHKTQVAQFVLDKSIADGTQVRIVYPATEGAKITAEQKKGTATNKHLITRAESDVITIQDGKASFALAHKDAVVRVLISSADYKGWKLKRVSIYSKDVSISDESDYARVTYTDPTVLPDGELVSVFSTKPVETATDFYVAVTLVDPTDDVKTTCLSKKFSGKTLDGGEVNVIPMKNLTLADNALAWYNPVCTRYIPEGGWAYGTSNTFVCAPEVGATGTFDVRAQGDFLDVIRYAKEPKGLQLRCGNMQKTGTGSMWTIDTTTPKKKAIVSLTNYNPTITYNKNSASLTNYVSGVFNLCDADGKVIWSYLCWAAWIDTFAKELTNGTVMDTNLGFGGTMTSDNTTLSNQGVYYQWGRPFPFGYPSGADGQTVNTSLRIKSFLESAENAASMGCTTDANNRDWWQDGTHKYDLWGNPEKTTTSAGGEKSIFDPCPKGWKVVSAAILKEVYDNATLSGNVYNYKETSWSPTYFISGETATRGSAKGLYWADNAIDDSHGLHYEINGETKSFNGTWRANACAVRCMKDTDNR